MTIFIFIGLNIILCLDVHYVWHLHWPRGYLHDDGVKDTSHQSTVNGANGHIKSTEKVNDREG